MKIYAVHEFWEEVSAGSDPSHRTVLFSTEEKRNAFVSDWNTDNANLEAANEPNKYFGGKGWVYWLEFNEIELDIVRSKFSNQIEKRY